MEMLKIEKTLQAVRELLDMLSNEGVTFALEDPNDEDCVATTGQRVGYISQLRYPP